MKFVLIGRNLLFVFFLFPNNSETRFLLFFRSFPCNRNRNQHGNIALASPLLACYFFFVCQNACILLRPRSSFSVIVATFWKRKDIFMTAEHAARGWLGWSLSAIRFLSADWLYLILFSWCFPFLFCFSVLKWTSKKNMFLMISSWHFAKRKDLPQRVWPTQFTLSAQVKVVLSYTSKRHKRPSVCSSKGNLKALL